MIILIVQLLSSSFALGSCYYDTLTRGAKQIWITSCQGYQTGSLPQTQKVKTDIHGKLVSFLLDPLSRGIHGLTNLFHGEKNESGENFRQVVRQFIHVDHGKKARFCNRRLAGTCLAL